MLVPDHHISGADEGVLEGDAAVRPAGAAVPRQEPVGGGAAVRSAPEGRWPHHCGGELAGSLSAGHQAGESHVQRLVSEQGRKDPEGGASIKHEGFIVLETGKLTPSHFYIFIGCCLHLWSSGSVDLTYSKVLYQDLIKGLDGLLLNSYLHLVYLVTPYDMLSQCKPDWMTYLRQVQACQGRRSGELLEHVRNSVALNIFWQFTLLSPAEQRMSAAIGVPESFIVRQAACQTVTRVRPKDVWEDGAKTL